MAYFPTYVRQDTAPAVPVIRRIEVKAIREAVPSQIKLHILGFAKADDIDSFHGYDIASFDTTSPRRTIFLSDRVILEILHYTLAGLTNQAPAATAAST